MCGIAGIIAANGASPPSPATISTMLGLIRHRGPDGHGLYIDDHAALGHIRLSIIDVDGGSQPMCNEDGSLWITFNGEVFNYIELRETLASLGHRFTTRSDTETIIHAFEQWGDDAWARFNGQFAVALWDARQRRLTLARDRVGIAPLYYAFTQNAAGRHLAFASEAKALFAPGLVSPSLDPAAIWKNFALWSTPAPATVWKDVIAIEPGQVISFDADLRPTQRRFWSLGFTEQPEHRHLDQAANGLEDRLTSAIRLRLRADVPVGAYLSGGLDSSLIAALTRREHSGPFHTFSLRFADPAFDETAPQRQMAALLGSDHHEFTCDDESVARALSEVVWHCEAPLMRLGPVPMFLLSDLVRRNGVKVVLTGEGADEFLGGYHIFRENSARRFWARHPGSSWRSSLLSGLHPYAAGASHQRSPMWMQFFRKGLSDTDNPFYSHTVRWENSAWVTRLLSEDFRQSADLDRILADLPAVMPPGWRQLGPLPRAQAIEITTFMSSYLLSSQGDRVALGHGVEPRFPFLDSDVIDYCCSLSRREKLSGLRDKVALRRLASRHLPAAVCQRPKWPFRAPIRSVLVGPGAPDHVRHMLGNEVTSRLGLADIKAVSALTERARSGATIGEREEMALVGIVTLHTLALHVSEGLAGHIRAADAAMARSPSGSIHDHRRNAGSSEAAA